MNKLIFSTFFCAVVLILSASDVFACTCMHLRGTVEDGYKRYPVIFSGKVISSVKSGDYSRKVTIQVQNSWKSKLPKTVTVFTGAQTSMCGFPFKKGESYLIYADGEKVKDLSVTLCSRTTLLSGAADDIEALNNLQKETKSSPK